MSVIVRQTPYSEKYLNLLSRYGKIEAHKEGCICVITTEAIKKYQRERIRKDENVTFFPAFSDAGIKDNIHSTGTILLYLVSPA